jgi:hypothetical protein
MKNTNSILFFLLINTFLSFSQDTCDSLVLFSDLKFHSDFEKKAFQNFVNHKTDTFSLFLAIDDTITKEDAAQYYNTYTSVYDELNQKKVNSKKLNKKIRMTYSIVHDRFLRKYNSYEFFPVTFQTGIYNCISASMLYSLIFDRLNITYKVKVSSDHVYLVANPGANSIVIETTNPGFEKAIFTGEFKQQYVNYLRDSKLISELDYRNKSVEEIFEEKFKEVEDAEFYNLQFTDKEAFCDSLFTRLISQITNKQIKEEASFTYFMKMSYYYYNSDKIDYYIENALKIKSNHRDANNIFRYNIERKLDRITDNKILLDTLEHFREKYDYEFIKPLFNEYELMVYLNNVTEALNNNKIRTGEKYLLLFEKNFIPPVETVRLKKAIESAYRGVAAYYFYRYNKAKAMEFIERGLKYVPGSRFIKSAVY